MTLPRSRIVAPGADPHEGERLLEVMEESDCYAVVYKGDPLDWVARFDKQWSESFDWANHMASTHNFRKEGSGGGEP